MLPVQSRYQSQFDGRVVDTSGSGATVFMEPNAIAALQGELAQLTVDEDAETRRILYTLSALVAEYAEPIRRNRRMIEKLDFLFAKAKLSAAMKANPVEIGASAGSSSGRAGIRCWTRELRAARPGIDARPRGA